MKKKVFISTIFGLGGVTMMTKLVIDFLLERDFSVSVGYYQPYALSPELSPRIASILKGKTVGFQKGLFYKDTPLFQIGAVLPEFEFLHYYPTKIWKNLINDHDYHICISGNIMPLLPLQMLKKKYLAWIASPYFSDKKDRAKKFSFARRLFDMTCNTPVSLLIERDLLKRGKVVALSNYVAAEFNHMASRKFDVMSMPISENFAPLAKKQFRDEFSIGFVGRYTDPRKNTPLLLNAFSLCKDKMPDARLYLIGADPDDCLKRMAVGLGISERINFISFMDREELVSFYQKLDIFVIPSYQEGLAIAGLEAMSCGVPVISTRCHGPEEYVINDKTGYLTGFNPGEVGSLLLKLYNNRDLLGALGAAARKLVLESYNIEAVRKRFWGFFEEVYGPEKR